MQQVPTILQIQCSGVETTRPAIDNQLLVSITDAVELLQYSNGL